MSSAQTLHGSPQAGLLVDDKDCLRCHGEKLDGAGLDGQCLIVHPANFQCVTLGSKQIGNSYSQSRTEQPWPPYMSSAAS